MAGEYDQWSEARERVDRYEAELGRVADMEQRRAIRARIEAAKRDRRTAAQALRAAADAGDREALAVIKELESWVDDADDSN